jgi:hypothetical protein
MSGLEGLRAPLWPGHRRWRKYADGTEEESTTKLKKQMIQSSD